MAIPGNLLNDDQQSIETSISQWAGDHGSSSSTVRSTAQFNDGVAAIAATYNGTTNNSLAGIVSSAPAVVVGTAYTFTYWVRSPRAVNFQILIEWYTSGNVFISGAAGVGTTAAVVNTWTQVGVGTTNVAPATAATARIYLMCTTGLTSGDVIYMDTIFFGVPVVAPPLGSNVHTTAIRRAATW
jgi:hypothetical protein